MPGHRVLVEHSAKRFIQIGHIFFQPGRIYKKSFHTHCPELMKIAEGIAAQIASSLGDHFCEDRTCSRRKTFIVQTEMFIHSILSKKIVVQKSMVADGVPATKRILLIMSTR